MINFTSWLSVTLGAPKPLVNPPPPRHCWPWTQGGGTAIKAHTSQITFFSPAVCFFPPVANEEVWERNRAERIDLQQTLFSKGNDAGDRMEMDTRIIQAAAIKPVVGTKAIQTGP